MLQNRFKGTDFSPNNQKKTQKKSHTCYIFFDLEHLCHIKIAVESPTEVYAPIIVLSLYAIFYISQ